MSRILLSTLLLLLAIGCSDPKPETQEQPASSAPRDTLRADPPERDKTFNPNNIDNFEKMVYMEYSYAATSAPKRVLDSIFKSALKASGDPMKAGKVATKQMEAYMKNVDSVARVRLAGKHDISIDSLNTIIKKQDAKSVSGKDTIGKK